MQATPLTQAPASIFKRVFAYLIDNLILFLFSSLAVYFLLGGSLNGALVVTFFQGCYKPVMEWRYGATVGKLSQRIRVVDAVTGGGIDLNQSLMRYLPWAISLFAAAFVLIREFQSPGFADLADVYAYVEFARGLPVNKSMVVQVLRALPTFSAVWLISDPLRQALHDKLAKTLVVDVASD